MLNLIVHFRKSALLADEPLDEPLNKSPASFSASQSQESLSQWIPCVASKKGTTSMGLLEMAGSMEQPKDYIDAELDIIAVHGLRGSPVRSWINRSPRTMWLRDMLQLDLSTSRVMSYGYRTEDVLRQNKFNLERLAEDLVSSIIDARAEIQDTSVRIAELVVNTAGAKSTKIASFGFHRVQLWRSLSQEGQVILMNLPQAVTDRS